MNGLLDEVKEQGIVDIIEDYVIQMEQIPYRKKFDKCIKDISEIKHRIVATTHTELINKHKKHSRVYYFIKHNNLYMIRKSMWHWLHPNGEQFYEQGYKTERVI